MSKCKKILAVACHPQLIKSECVVMKKPEHLYAQRTIEHHKRSPQLKEERNYAIWLDRVGGATFAQIAKKYGICASVARSHFDDVRRNKEFRANGRGIYYEN